MGREEVGMSGRVGGREERRGERRGGERRGGEMRGRIEAELGARDLRDLKIFGDWVRWIFDSNTHAGIRGG